MSRRTRGRQVPAASVVVVGAPAAPPAPIGPVPGGLRIELAHWTLAHVSEVLRGGVERAEAAGRQARRPELVAMYDRHARACGAVLAAIDAAHLEALNDGGKG